MRVLFLGNHPLGRCENITALYEAWDGDKEFAVLSRGGRDKARDAEGRFNVVVCDEFIPPVKGKRYCKTLFVTHGIAGGKTYGLDQKPRPYITKAHGQGLDYIVAPSEHMRGLMAKQCGVGIERVIPLGMPRTDAYFPGPKRAEPFDAGGKRVYLYAPTFRARGEYPDIDWEMIDGLLGDDELLIVKRHMIIHKTSLHGYRHIMEVPSEEPTAPYLMACDALATDYSSILFDAHVANKPVVLFAKPGDTYLQRRGMYKPYPDWYASRFAEAERPLIQMLRDADRPLEADKACREEAAGMCDGHSTERVIEFIRSIV